MPKTKSSALPFLIAGGGIAGLSVAIALARKGWPVHILEQRADFSEAGAGIQLSANAIHILAEWNLQAALAKAASYPEKIAVYDGLNGQKLTHIPLGALADKRYGAPYMALRRQDLHRILVEKAESYPSITLTRSFRVAHISPHEGSVFVRSQQGQEVCGRALIGADGVWSTVRNNLAPDAPPVFSGQTAWRACLDKSQVPEAILNTAGETFDPFSSGATCLWLAPHAHLVHYPIQNGKALNIVVIIAEDWQQKAWNCKAQGEELVPSFAGWVSWPRHLLCAQIDWQKWALFESPYLGHWSKGLITLTGDCAHAMLPFLAQGAAMAIEDSAQLARALEESPENIEQAFLRYQTLRRERTYRVQYFSRKMGRLYHMKGVRRILRNFILKRGSGAKLLARYDWLYGYS